MSTCFARLFVKTFDAHCMSIDFASRFPRGFEASRLRDLGASRLADIRIIGRRVKLDLKDLLGIGSTFGV